MPDNIERTIYKLELDSTGYINGIESLSSSTKKLTTEQDRANKALEVSKGLLKQQSDFLLQTKKDLDSYTGTNEKYRLQLAKTFSTAEADNQKLTEEVLKNQKAYEAATKAAQDFANVSARASNLQAQTTGGKIPTPASIPPNVSANITSQIAGVLNIPEFTAQAQIIEQTKNEFDDLRVSIGLAEARMKQLNATDDEFKLLAPIVEQGKEALKQYDIVTGNATEKMSQFRTQILQGTNELLKLKEAGQQNSAEYTDLQNHVAKLTQEYREQRQAIKFLSSETRGIDFGKAAVQSAISAFQVYTSISILAGGASEELQKKTLQLFAAMQLLSSLEQLAVSIKKGSILATGLQTTAQTIYTAVVGASTGALKAFRIALAATGIGAAIILIGFLISKWSSYADALKKADENQKLLNEGLKAGAKASAEAGNEVDVLKIKFDLAKKGLIDKKEVLEEYNNTLGKTLGVTKDFNEAEETTIKNAAAYINIVGLKARAQAIANLRIKESEKSLTADLEDNRSAASKAATFLFFNDKGNRQAYLNQVEKDKQRFVADVKNQSNSKIDFLSKEEIRVQEELAIAQSQFKDKPKSFDDKKGTKRAVKEIQDDFEARKAALLAEINKLAETEFQSEISIRKVYDDKLKKAIAELKKDKGLKPGERTELIKLTAQVNTTELDKALEDFRKKQVDARQKLNAELNALQDKNAQDQLNLIQDEFDRRAKLIQFNEDKEIVDTIIANQKRLEEFDKSSQLIYGKDYQNNQNYLNRKALLVAAGEQAITDIVLDATEKRNKLSQDIFQSLLQQYQNAITNVDLIRDKEQADSLQALSAKLLSGKISIEKFNKEVKKIQEFYADDKRKRDIVTETGELADLDRKLAAEVDKYSDYYKKLKAQRDALDEDLQKKRIAVAEKPPPDPNKDKTDNVAKYAEAIGAVADSVIQFWQAANDAETKALDRSISLQEKRVAAAQRIADRGNAQYLKAEEDRLTELNVKRENAARKQLGIDAALQASQILVGITGAIAKIATPGVGIAETIGSIAIIIGALATGYGLVKSLQGNQPKLFKGTPHVERAGQPAGIDTIPAWLNEGEAVIPTEKNKKYKKSVEAIYHGKVPADVMNDFVENYVKNNYVKNVKNIENKSNIQNTSNETIYKQFVNNVSKVPAKVLNNFINNYSSQSSERKYFKGTTEVKNIWAKESLAKENNNLFKPAVKPVLSSVPVEHLNSFINNYHTIKPVPQVNYERIKEAAEIHISQDGRMHVAINEQNKLIVENTEVQKQVLRAVKTMGVHFNWDKNGVELSMMEALDKRKIDQKI